MIGIIKVFYGCIIESDGNILDDRSIILDRFSPLKFIIKFCEFDQSLAAHKEFITAHLIISQRYFSIVECDSFDLSLKTVKV